MSVIYNHSSKSKSQLREEGDKALQEFLRKGGTIEVSKPSRRKHRAIMSAKSTRYVTGTSGFANGFPKRTIGA